LAIDELLPNLDERSGWIGQPAEWLSSGFPAGSHHPIFFAVCNFRESSVQRTFVQRGFYAAAADVVAHEPGNLIV
jgi:hypothetical protein